MSRTRARNGAVAGVAVDEAAAGYGPGGVTAAGAGGGGVLPRRRARRLGSVRWLDLRLVAGVALVLVAILLGNRVLAERGDVVTVWRVTKPVVAGSVLTADALVPVSVPAGLAASYLAAASAPPADRRLVHGLVPGELVPTNALVEAGQLDLRRVVLTVPAASTVGLGAHRIVDIYVAPATSGSRSATVDASDGSTTLVLEGATVDEVAASSGLSASSSTGVAVLVPAHAVTDVLDAQAHGQIVLVQRPDESAVEQQ